MLEYDLSRPDQARIAEWRALCFAQLGFGLSDAVGLAKRRDIDRVHVQRMLEHGATHGQVLDIVI